MIDRLTLLAERLEELAPAEQSHHPAARTLTTNPDGIPDEPDQK